MRWLGFWTLLGVFLAVTGHLFYLTLTQLTAAGPKGVEFPMQYMLGDEKFWLVYLFIPPLLTMRLFAEERTAASSPFGLAFASAQAKVCGVRVLVDGSCLGPFEMGTQVATLSLVSALAEREDWPAAP